MIRSDDQYRRTRQYVDGLQEILLELRRTSTPSQYEWMSKAYLKELTKAQREIAMYLAPPEVHDKAA